MIFRARLLAALTSTAFLACGLLAGSASAVAPSWQPVSVTGPTVLPLTQSETQQVYVDAEGGTFTLTFSGQTTAPIAFDAAPATLESSLNALSSIGGVGGSVQVTGGPGGPEAKTPYSVAFGGSLANTNVAQMTVNSTALTGASPNAAVATLVIGGQGTTTLALYLQNKGGIASSGTITYEAKLPAGITLTKAPSTEGGPDETDWSCGGVAGDSAFTCTYPNPIQSTATGPVINATITATGSSAAGIVETEVSGGGAPTATFQMPLGVGSIPAGPGIQTFVGGGYDDEGNPDTQAGSHPYSASTAIFANTKRLSNGEVIPSGEFRDIIVDVPPGFLGNPIAVPECPESVDTDSCHRDTMVGIIDPVLNDAGKFPNQTPVINTEAPIAYPAKFRFTVFGFVRLNAVGSLRSDEDYGLTVGSINTPQINQIFGAFFTFWGAPASDSFDNVRCTFPGQGCVPSTVPNTAFLTNPSSCEEQALRPPMAFLRANLWQNPGETFFDNFDIAPVEGCEKLEFNADFTFEPSDTKSDSPASFKTSLTLPSEGLTDPTKLANPPIKTAVVSLPDGVTLNPSASDGLQACSKEQIGFKGSSFPMPNPMRFNKDPHQCPDASKIGTGELKTELLRDPLKGELFLAAQGDGNPYGSLFAIYLVIEDPRHGIFVKLPGRVDANEQTGKLTTTFENLPQIPFTRLDLTLKGGNRSALASPRTCGNFVTTAINTPWSAPQSGPPTESANGFEINQGPNGQPCAPTLSDRPLNVTMSAGTDSVGAGAFSPLTFHITRPDGSQEIETLELQTAKGMAASLRGVPRCSDQAIAGAANSTGRSEQASPACSSASEIGRVVTAAGAGPTPFYTGGKLYLAGPYKGAPVSVVAITPAVAGPFDLGNVVVRTGVYLNRATAQVTAKADPIPQVLEGVPLRIRDIRVFLDRPGFSLNPTSCEASQITAKVNGNSGATANLSSNFQVAGCGDLGFKPKFAAKLIGGTKRGDHPAFQATVTWPEGGYANTKDVSVMLPKSAFLDQANIRTICTRVQAAADTCPPGAIYGEAEAVTPLLDEPLKGPVFLKSSDNKLPDLAIKLRGPASMPVEVEFQGRIDSIKGRIRDTIEGLPDVPVSKFVLKMQGGRKGLLVNSRNLCIGKPGRMDVKVLGQNNKRADQTPRLDNSCKKAKKKKRKGAKKRSKR